MAQRSTLQQQLDNTIAYWQARANNPALSPADWAKARDEVKHYRWLLAGIDEMIAAGHA